MSEILGDTGKRVSGGRALLLCICHECGSNFEIQRRRFSQLKPCLRCLRKKQKAYEPFYTKIEELEHKLEMEIEEIDKYKVAYNIVSDSSNWESCTGQGCWLGDKARDKLLEVFK
jgi:reverse gyrase